MKITIVALLVILTCIYCFGFCLGKPKIVIQSGGSTFAIDVYKIWRPMYLSTRTTYADVVFTYAPVGSGTGVKHFNDKTYDFAGTDIPLAEASYNNTDDIQMFPTMAGPVSIAYNIPELGKACTDYSIINNSNCLNLTREAVIGIFNGTVRHWNDSTLLAHNKALVNVSAPIIVIVRQDTSGTTNLFTNALAAFSSDWKAAYGIFSDGCMGKDKPVKWNSTINIRCGAQMGVTGLLVTTPYSVGYCATSEAHDSGLAESRILNKANQWVNPSATTTQAAMDSFVDALGTRLTGTIVDGAGKNAYPIAGYTYFLFRKRSMSNCTVAQEIFRFFTFILSDPLSRNVVRDLIKSPVSDRVLAMINQQVFVKAECGNKKISDLVRVSISIETGTIDAWKVPVAVCLSILMIVLIVVGSSFCYIQYLRNRNVLNGTYIIQVEIPELTKQSAVSFSSTNNTIIEESSGAKSYLVHVSTDEKALAKPLCRHFDSDTLLWNTRKLLVQMKYELHHINIIKIFGITLRDHEWKIITGWAKKGRLQDVIHAGKYHLSSGVRYSIAHDITEGMIYLHKNEIVHGQLTSKTCYIDGRWNSQVGDWEQNLLHLSQKIHFTAFEPTYRVVFDAYPKDKTNLNEYCQMLYASPSEVLEQDSKKLYFATGASKAADVHSFGIVMYEIFSNTIPFENLTLEGQSKWKPLDVVKMIKTDNIQPRIPDEMQLEHPSIVEIIKTCWDAQPASRPTFVSIGRSLKTSNPRDESVVDTMMQAIEHYATSLEEKVMERTNEMEKVTQNMKTLLHNMLPPSIADKLSKGQHVEPEFYDSVTLLFTDIVGFTSLASLSLPIQIVDLLNDLYTSFDSVISNYDAYKVETIGDSYMCISGLPHRNGVQHAPEIGTMTLDILNIVPMIRIRHMPDTVLRVRAGCHSGSVMAGVVGLKMPRYCLFGDTVNTASRMESSSLPMRIQISEDTKLILDIYKVFQVHLRGTREVKVCDIACWAECVVNRCFAKGKGSMTTYWLTGKQGYTKELPVFDPSQDNELLSMLDKNQVK